MFYIVMSGPTSPAFGAPPGPGSPELFFRFWAIIWKKVVIKKRKWFWHFWTSKPGMGPTIQALYSIPQIGKFTAKGAYYGVLAHELLQKYESGINIGA